MQVNFNYIVTIHNKESLIGEVILHVIKCMRNNSKLYAVLDGCTDNSEKITDDIIKDHPQISIKKVHANDIHELKSINIGLRSANQDGTGYNIILQDDVLLNDIDIEHKVINLYKVIPNLGIVSFRHGSNISRKLITKKGFVFPSVDYIESVLGHTPNPLNYLKLGYFTYREIATKSPICIPFHVVRSVGLPDEIYAPWDDIAYCYKVSQAGFLNGVYALNFRSDVEWGTTRTKKQQLDLLAVEEKNLKLFKQIHGDEFKSNPLNKLYSSNKKYPIDKKLPTGIPVPWNVGIISLRIKERILNLLKGLFYK